MAVVGRIDQGYDKKKERRPFGTVGGMAVLMPQA
jgi:hypothetical protein